MSSIKVNFIVTGSRSSNKASVRSSATGCFIVIFVPFSLRPCVRAKSLSSMMPFPWSGLIFYRVCFPASRIKKLIYRPSMKTAIFRSRDT